MYIIPCRCAEHAYAAETDRKWMTQEKERKDKARLTHENIRTGNMERATQRMNERDGGLAKHSVECTAGINWEEAKVIGREEGRMQRNMLEGVETIKQKAMGRKPLNISNQMEHWQATIYSFLETT